MALRVMDMKYFQGLKLCRASIRSFLLLLSELKTFSLGQWGPFSWNVVKPENVIQKVNSSWGDFYPSLEFLHWWVSNERCHWNDYEQGTRKVTGRLPLHNCGKGCRRKKTFQWPWLSWRPQGKKNCEERGEVSWTKGWKWDIRWRVMITWMEGMRFLFPLRTSCECNRDQETDGGVTIMNVIPRLSWTFPDIQ